MTHSKRSPQRWLLPSTLLLVGVLFFFSQCSQNNQDPWTLNIQMAALPKTLNPFLSPMGATTHLAGRIMYPLGVFDADQLTMQPVLVTKIPDARNITEGPDKGLIAYDFELHEAAKWDDGSPITAHDVEFTFKLIFNPQIPEMERWKGYYLFMKKIEVDPSNPKKFTVFLSEPYILGLHSLCQVPILPAYAYDPQNNLKDIPLQQFLQTTNDSGFIKNQRLKAAADEFKSPKYGNDVNSITGCGPYKVTLLSENLVTLVKKDNWWGDALATQYPYLAAYPKQINYRLIVEDPVIETMLKTKELDLVYNPNPIRFLQWQQDPEITKNYNFETRWAPAYNRLLLNLTNPKLSDKRVRQAIAHAINYDNILSQVFKGFGNRIVGPIHSSKSYYAKDLNLYNFDLSKAQSLLAEAGWTDQNGNGIVEKDLGTGKPTELKLQLLATTAIPVVKDMVENIRESARQAGIDIEIVAVSPTEGIQRSMSGDYEIFAGAAALNTGLDDFYQQFHSKSFATKGDNRSRFSNASADSLMDAIRIETDVQKRKNLYLRFQSIVHEEVPEIFLLSSMQRYIVAKRIKPVLTPERPGYYDYLFQLR